MKYSWNIEKIKELVKISVNFTEVLNGLGIPRQGNNSKTLKDILDRNNIDYAHFTGRARYYNTKKIPIEEYLSNKRQIQSFVLKEKLIREGIKENRCESCGITEWQGKPIVCQLHHIDGNPSNNSIGNLQILCPNCHSQTDNFCGKANDVVPKNFCKICGKPISRGAIHCSVCSKKERRKTERPEKWELLQKYRELGSMVKVGEYYRVSDNAVRKWLKSYNMPSSRGELLKIVEKSDCCSLGSNPGSPT